MHIHANGTSLYQRIAQSPEELMISTLRPAAHQPIANDQTLPVLTYHPRRRPRPAARALSSTHTAHSTHSNRIAPTHMHTHTHTLTGTVGEERSKKQHREQVRTAMGNY